jgi:sugar O-acyltransferase (sialic acid O-acetyltransferase NeuD family)
MESIVLIGGGGHCRSCIDVIEKEGRFSIRGILERPQNPEKEILGYPFIGTDDDIPQLVEEGYNFVITIGQIGAAPARKKIFNLIKEFGGKLPVIKSPLAYISQYASIEAGTMVMHGVIVNASARIGFNNILNTNSLIEHDSRIGSHCHIATGAIVNGGVIIEDEVFLGSGAVTKQNSRIVSGTFVKANSIVK